MKYLGTSGSHVGGVRMTIFINSLTKHQDVLTRNKWVPVRVSEQVHINRLERERGRGREREREREGKREGERGGGGERERDSLPENTDGFHIDITITAS